MRVFDHYQLSLMSQSWVEHPHAEELAEIGEILDSDPGLVNLVIADLASDLRFPGRGARGLSPSLVLRALILKQMHGYSYEELTFHLTDSVSFRLRRTSPFERGLRQVDQPRHVAVLTPPSDLPV